MANAYIHPKHNFEKLFIQLNLTYSFLPLTNMLSVSLNDIFALFFRVIKKTNKVELCASNGFKITGKTV